MEQSESMRRCILTRMSLPTSRLVRFVVAPDRTVVPDVAEKLPGRGLWLRAERDIIDRACSTQLFARTSGENVVQPTDLSDRLEQLLAARCFDLIGLARRAGQAVSGYEKVRAKLRHKMTRHGVGAILLIASDGPSAAASRMDALTQGAVILQAFDGAEIGAAFGRKRVVYAVIGCGQIADSLVVEMCRLEGLRSTPNSGKPN
jgi:predicted RNA-binding protein YlxR (DUF448 family)